MKKLCKNLALMLTVCLLVGAFAACRREVTPNSASDLEISVWEAGLGREWLDRLAEAYRKRNPDVNVIVSPTQSSSLFSENIDFGAEFNTVDLFFSLTPKYMNFVDKNQVEPLDDVYSYTVPGESLSIAEKMNATLEQCFNVDGHYYAAPWMAQGGGLVYNYKMFRKYGWSLPRTTTELVRLALDIKSEGITPFIHNQNDYWQQCTYQWWAQYDGLDVFFDYWRLRDEEGKQPSKKVFRSKGKEEAYKVLEQLVAPDGYVYSGSNSISHTIAQTYFLAGEAAMMPNGGWLENEMISNFESGSVDVRFMRIPVLSSLGTKLGITESQLRACVDYVDGVTKEMPGGVSDEAIAAVREARSMAHTEATRHTALIPSYASAKEEAKNFLKFMYSDEGIAIYIDALHSISPVNYSDGREIDITGWSEFAKAQYNMLQDCKYVYSDYSYPFYYRTSLEAFFFDVPEHRFSAAGELDRMTASEFLEKERNYIDNNWNSLLTVAGLN